MLFGRHPDMAITPGAELTQLLHFGMILTRIVFHGQFRRIENANVTAETL